MELQTKTINLRNVNDTNNDFWMTDEGIKDKEDALNQLVP